MKTLVLNSKLTNRDFFKEHDIDVEYEYAEMPGVFPLIQTTSHLNAQGEMVDFYTPDVMEAVRNMIKPLQYSRVIFCFNPEDYGPQLSKTGGSTFGPDVYLGTQLCVVRIDGHEELYASHEEVHMDIHDLSRRRYPVTDSMDIALINGVQTPYYKNEDREAIDGNYALTLASIKPYISKLGQFPPNLSQNKTFNEWVFSLQLQLLSLGYDVGMADGVFGPKTLGVIRNIQTAHGLTVDGIVGPKTLQTLKKKDNFLIDIAKWGLVPELQEKAKVFFQKCHDYGYDLKITQGFRSMDEQAEIYSHGRNGDTRPIITHAKPGESKHNFGKAFDVAFNGGTPYPTDDRLWTAIANIGVSCGLTAGLYFKNFQDKPHFEIS